MKPEHRSAAIFLNLGVNETVTFSFSFPPLKSPYMQTDNRAPSTKPDSPQPPRPRPDRFARFTRQLKVMKAEGRSTDDMLNRLRVQGVVVDETELADFWASQAAAAQAKAQARAKKGRAELPLRPKGPDAVSSPAMQYSPDGTPIDAKAFKPLDPHAEEIVSRRTKGALLPQISHWLEITHGIIIKGSVLAAFLKKHEDAAKAKAQAEAQAKAKADLEYEQLMYMAPGGAPQSTLNDKPPQSPLDTVMANYLKLANEKIAEGDKSPESIKIIDKMVRTLMAHERDKTRNEQRERALRIKEQEHHLKMMKVDPELMALAEAKLKKAEEAATAARYAHIAAMRLEYFKEIDELEASDPTMPMPTLEDPHPAGRLRREAEERARAAQEQPKPVP
jgi:hypothetical protein